MVVVVGRDSWMIVVIGRDSWMIDVPVVLYFGLTEGDVNVVSSVDASPSSESFVD